MKPTPKAFASKLAPLRSKFDVFNNTKGSVLIAILAHASMDAFPNGILWPLFPAASKMTEYRLLYGYIGLSIGFGVTTFLIIIFTRGRLGLPALPSRKPRLVAEN